MVFEHRGDVLALEPHAPSTAAAEGIFAVHRIEGVPIFSESFAP